jgi:hypothetical protein
MQGRFAFGKNYQQARARSVPRQWRLALIGADA